MTLEELIKICNPVDISGDEPYAIRNLQQDSRLVKDDDLFIAVRGLRTDGHDFIEDAIFRGASVIVCEEPYYTDDKGVSVIEVEETRPLLGELAQAFHGYPADKLTTIGITGTNGKTTVATLTWQILQKIGIKTGLLGTVRKYYGTEESESRLTTADPIEIAGDLKKMVDAGCSTVSMEISSHALDQQRTSGINWDVAVFTNLSHDHLDYHKDFDHYASAKKKLFDSLNDNAWAIVNFDDPRGPFMIEDCASKIIDFSFQKNSSIHCKILESGEQGSLIQIDDIKVETPLPGRFNAYNVTEAFLTCTALGYDAQLISRAIKDCPGADGRLEKVTIDSDKGDKPTIFVDYAHTPDALKNAAVALSEVKQKQRPLLILFGCGGDRDTTKRPEMAEIAEQYADKIIVTSDNPRSEDPEKIIRDIEKGFSANAVWESIPSREEAIKHIIQEAPADGIILIAGKGHETYQEIKGKRIHFDDREVARQALQKLNTNPKNEEGK